MAMLVLKVFFMFPRGSIAAIASLRL